MKFSYHSKMETRKSIFVAFLSLLSLAQAVPRAEVADFCFLVDVTGSMKQYIEGVKLAIGRIIDEMESSQIEQLRVAFVGYRDISDTEPFVQIGFTSNIAAFRQFVATVEAKGGGDTPEDVFGGLEKVPQLEWSEDAGTRVMLHIADSPCHGKKYHNIWGRHPDGDPKGRDINKLLGDIRKKFIDYNFGRISAWKTDKMIAEFGKVWGESIPQMEINPEGSSLTGPSIGSARGVIGSALGRVSSRKGPVIKKGPMGPTSRGGSRGGGISVGTRGLPGAPGPMPAPANVNLSKQTGDKIANASLSALSKSFAKAKARLSKTRE